VDQRQYADRLVPEIHQAGEFDLVFEIVEGLQDWRLNATYRTTVFENVAVERLLSRFGELLAAVAENPQRSLGQLLPDEELSRSGSRTFDYPRERCVQELIEEQVFHTPDATAALFKDRQLSYRELDERANQLAHYLVHSGVRPGALVGVMLNRSLEMLIGLLAAWKAGAAYVPFDPNHPAERLAYIMVDAGAKFLITEVACPFRGAGIRAIEIDREQRAIGHQPVSKPDLRSASAALAYVIYTSGSTGKPKGVQISHRSLTNFLCSMARSPGCTAYDYVLASTTICFDIAALELFLPLVTGARVEILEESIVKNGLRFKEKLENSPATLVQATPATWKMLLAADLGTISRVKALCGGEAWDSQLADQLLVRTRELWNMYGPTETTIWSSIHKVESGRPICLGDPIGNTKFYVFDELMRAVEPGEIGELFIGGDGLANGYLNRPELTRERFVSNPLRPEEVIYRTGDLVRYV
jgi:amino acid adenylation domain-containing protein